MEGERSCSACRTAPLWMFLFYVHVLQCWETYECVCWLNMQINQSTGSTNLTIMPTHWCCFCKKKTSYKVNRPTTDETEEETHYHQRYKAQKAFWWIPKCLIPRGRYPPFWPPGFFYFSMRECVSRGGRLPFPLGATQILPKKSKKKGDLL